MKYLFLLLFSFSSLSLAKDEIHLYLKWKHQFQFAGYYAALEKGFYAEEGLNVILHERDKSWSPLNKVSGKIASYGISDSTIIRHYLRGKDVLLVSAIFQHSPLVLATRKEDNFLSPSDLYGRKVMYQKDIDDAVFKKLFEVTGFRESDIKHIPHSFDSEDLINKKVDAISIYTTNQPYYFKLHGQNINIISPSNYGIDLYGDLIFTSKQEVLKYPSRVKAFKRASIKGWYYALNNKEEIIKLIQEKYSIGASRGKLLFEAKETEKIIKPNIVNIGHTHPARLKKLAALYAESENLDLSKIQIENMLFNYFLIEHSNRKNKLTRYLIISAITILTLFLLIFMIRNKLKSIIRQKTNHMYITQQEKNIFFSNMTHEIRTPINSILAATELLKDTQPTKDQIDLINMLDFSSQNLIGLVNDILDFSKLESKKFILNPTPVNLNSIINKFIQSYESEIKSKNLKFKTQIDIPLNFTVDLDSKRFIQILNNLMSNAIKFTKEGQIDLQINIDRNSTQEYLIKASVKDTGKGILSDNFEMIFSPYQQENNKIATSFGGTGLGLTITKELINLMKGHIYVEHNVPRGSCFHFEIPVTESLNFITRQELSEKLLLSKEKKLLIVDDNEMNLKVFKLLFKDLPNDIFYSNSPKEAIKLIGENEFDLIIIDKFMPEISGEELIKYIKENISPVPYIIGCSSNWITGLDPEARNSGADATLTKPIIKKDLICALNRAEINNKLNSN